MAYHGGRLIGPLLLVSSILPALQVCSATRVQGNQKAPSTELEPCVRHLRSVCQTVSRGIDTLRQDISHEWERAVEPPEDICNPKRCLQALVRYVSHGFRENMFISKLAETYM
jgi:hypothetical protein